MFALLFISCMDSTLHRIDDPQVGTEPEDTGSVPEVDPPEDEPEDEPVACPQFSMRWSAPFVGWLHIEGELLGPEGETLESWNLWGEPVEGDEVVVTIEVCDEAAFRGSGAADLDDDGFSDAWSCTLQADGSFALTGSVEFHLDGQALEVFIVPDPASPGCGVMAVFPPSETE